jgi:ribosome maturation factor RimP
MKNKLEHIIESNIAENHVLMSCNEGGKGHYIRSVIDSSDPITLGDTTTLAKKLRDSEDLIDLFPEGFRLEVTTPGIGQPLEKKFQYTKNLNRELKVKYTDIDEIISVNGKLTEVGKDFVELKSKKEIFKIKFDKILAAKVKISFK